MKKIISIVLIITMMSAFFVDLAGCDSATKDNYITKGEWLSLINRSFGMYSYQSDTPYLDTVSSSNEYFKDVQIAAEWEVIGKNEKLDVNDYVTKQYAINTLVNAGEFCGVDASDDEKRQAAYQYGILKDDAASVVGLSGKIDYNEALELLSNAQKNWANKSYDGVHENLTYKDGVVDFTGSQYSSIAYENDESQTAIDGDYSDKIVAGDIYVLPATAKNPEATVHKAEAVTIKNGKTIITNSSKEPELSDIADKIDIKETFIPNLLSGGQILDGNGNPVNDIADGEMQGMSYSSTDSGSISNLLATNQKDYQAQIYTAVKSHKLSFTYGKYSIEGKIASDSVTFTVSKSIYEDKSTGLKKSGKLFAAVKLNDMKVTNDVDYDWGKLRSVTSKIDYNTEVSGGVSCSYDKTALRVTPYNNGFGNIISNLKKISLRSGSSRGAESIKICAIPIASGGVVNLYLEVRLEISITGEVKVAVNINGSKGVQYKNNNVRFINSNGADVDISAKGSFEPTLKLGLKVKVLTAAVIGFSVNGGFGIALKTIAHVADSDNHLIEQGEVGDVEADAADALSQCGAVISVADIKKVAQSQGGTYDATDDNALDVSLRFDLCFDLVIYPVVKIGVDEETLAGDILSKLKVKYSAELLGENDAFFKMHVESLSDLSSWASIKSCIGRSCTKKYNPFDSADDANKASVSPKVSPAVTKAAGNKAKSGIQYNNGKVIDIKEYQITLDIGGKSQLEVTSIPKGYKVSDIKYESVDPSIATIDKNGNIKAISSGITKVRVYTSDGKAEAMCAIFVNSKGKVI